MTKLPTILAATLCGALLAIPGSAEAAVLAIGSQIGPDRHPETSVALVLGSSRHIGADRHPDASVLVAAAPRVGGDRHPGVEALRSWPHQDIYVSVKGTEVDDLTMWPRVITMESDHLYRVVFVNRSALNHLLMTEGFAGDVLSFEAASFLGRMVGPVEVETGALVLALAPGDMLEWFLLPANEGDYALGCAIPSHAAAGMHAEIRVY